MRRDCRDEKKKPWALPKPARFFKKAGQKRQEARVAGFQLRFLSNFLRKSLRVWAAPKVLLFINLSLPIRSAHVFYFLPILSD